MTSLKDHTIDEVHVLLREYEQFFADKAQGTKEVYLRTVRDLIGWISQLPRNEGQFQPSQLTQAAVECYLTHLEREGLSVNHRARVKSTLSNFAQFLNQNSEELVGVEVGLGVKSEIATVFKVETQHRGVLLTSSSRKFFSEQDLHFLQAVARWIGIGIHRAELVERLRQESFEQGRRLAATACSLHPMHSWGRRRPST